MGNKAACCRSRSDTLSEVVDADADVVEDIGQPRVQQPSHQLSVIKEVTFAEAGVCNGEDADGNEVSDNTNGCKQPPQWDRRGSNLSLASWSSDASFFAKSTSAGQFRGLSRTISKLPDSFRAYSSVHKQRPSAEEIRVFFRSVIAAGVSASVQGSWANRYLTPTFDAELTRRDLQIQFEVLMPDLLGSEEVERVIDRISGGGGRNIAWEAFREAVDTGPDSTVLTCLIRRYRDGCDHGFTVPDDFDFGKPTSVNYTDKGSAFVGDFADIRRGRDYSYHAKYSEERQMWQDHAIHTVIEHITHQHAPWLVYTCGPMGVGKGYALSWMSRNGFFPMESIAHVDPDGFKQMMPEWCTYVERNRSTAGSMCHAESTFMMEIAQLAAMQKRQHVWIDGSLRDADFYSEQFLEMRAEFPHYRIAIFYVDAPEEIIRQRIKERAQKTGRDVPEHLIKASLSAMDRALNKLTPLCDFVARIDNGGSVPVLRSFETINNSGSWNLIKERFSRPTLAGEFPNALAPLPLARLPSEHMEIMSKRKSNAQHGLAVTLEVTKYRGEVPDLHRKVGDVLGGSLDFQVSQVCKVTLPAFARHLAMVPLEATSFCWLYPHSECREGGRLHQKAVGKKGFNRQDMLDPLMQMLRQGAFVYLSNVSEIIAVNFVSSHAENFLLQFGLPVDVPSSCLSELAKEDRLQPVPRAYFRNRGASRCMWAPPGETVADFTIGQEHGGFVYTFEDQKRPALVYPVMAAD